MTSSPDQRFVRRSELCPLRKMTRVRTPASINGFQPFGIVPQSIVRDGSVFLDCFDQDLECPLHLWIHALCGAIKMAGGRVISVGFSSRFTVCLMVESAAFLFSPTRATRAMVLECHNGAFIRGRRAGNQSLRCPTAMALTPIASHLHIVPCHAKLDILLAVHTSTRLNSTAHSNQ